MHRRYKNFSFVELDGDNVSPTRCVIDKLISNKRGRFYPRNTCFSGSFMNLNNNPISQIIKDLSDPDEENKHRNIKQRRLKGKLSKIKTNQTKLQSKINSKRREIKNIISNKKSAISKEYILDRRDLLFTPETNAESQNSKAKVLVNKIEFSPLNIKFDNKLINEQIKMMKTKTKRQITERDAKAAITIQRMFRGYSGRKFIKHFKQFKFTRSKLDLKIREMEEAIDQTHQNFMHRNQKCVVTIQSLFRANKAKNKVKNLSSVKCGIELIIDFIKEKEAEYLSIIFEVFRKDKEEARLKRLLEQKKEEESKMAFVAKIQEEQKRNKFMINAFRNNDISNCKTSPTMLKPITFKGAANIKEEPSCSPKSKNMRSDARNK